MSAADTAPVRATVLAAPGTSITASVAPGADDPDPGNNTWRAVLD